MSSSAEAEGQPNDVRKPPVVAGVDGSDSARHAGEWAAELASAWGAALHLVHVTSDGPAAHGADPPWLRELRDAAEHTGVVDVATRVVAGAPATQLAECSRDAGMVVVGRAPAPSSARPSAESRAVGGQIASAPADPAVHDEDVVELHAIHEATVRACRWDELLDRLDHGFRPAGCDLRYTIGPWAQREILDRLLELNHERYAEEVAKGRHDKKKARTARAPKKSDVEGLF